MSEVALKEGPAFVGVIRDITARRHADEQSRLRLHEMAHTSRLLELGEMTSGIAHEVNQPLTAIVSFAEACARMIESGTADRELLSGALEQITAQGQRAAEIIQRMRHFVRKGEGQRERLQLNPLLATVLELLAHDLRAGAVEVACDFDPTLPGVSADRIQIEQVVVNLVRNACEAMKTGDDDRRLTLRTRAVGDRVEVTVADSGPGLPPDAEGRLFEAFFTTKAEGVGVGLAISRSLIIAHGGDLTAATGERGGATFRFTLPVRGEA